MPTLNKMKRRPDHLLKCAGCLTLLFLLASLMIPAPLTRGARAQEQSRRPAGKFLKSQGANAIPDQYIVVLRDNTPGRDVDSVAAEMAQGHGGTIGHVYRHALKGFSIRLPEAAALALSHDPRVEYVEEDGEVYPSVTQFSPPWGLDRIDQRNLPLSGSYTYTNTGAGVHAYVIDSGIFAAHTQFGGRANGNGTTFIADGNGTNDCYGHGTHVAGTIGGSTYGVAKGVTLHSVRVFNCSGGGASDASIAAAVDWVTGNHMKPAVANMSLGGQPSATVDQAVRNSINNGLVTYVVSAGNQNIDAINRSPARVAEALTVAATGNHESPANPVSDQRTSFSNWGAIVDVFAPGAHIPSALPNFPVMSGCTITSTTTNAWAGNCSGTSMAGPHVAGVAALFLEGNPSASPATVTAAIINGSTPNVVTNPGPGSPNRLLYSLIVGPPPFYEGFVDYVDCDAIVGWAADRNSLNTSITVSIYDGSTLVTTVLANELRSDVGAYFGDNGRHGFAIPMPSRFKNGLQHTLRVKFEAGTHELIGSPRTIACGSQTTYYEIIARHSGKCLNVAGGSTATGAMVTQSSCVGVPNQHWQVIPIGGGYYKFIARHSNKVIDVKFGALDNGTPVWQMDQNGTAAQQWQIIDVGGGYSRIIAHHSGKALDVAGGSTADGAQVHQWDYVSIANQQWLLRRLP